MSTEAINQMIEALEKAKRQCQYHNIAPHGCYDDAIAVGRQAIDTASQLKEAEKKQTNDSEVEPVAWLWELTGEVTTDPDRADGMWQPLYTSRPYVPTERQRPPLTDEQIEALLVNWPEDGIAFFEFARAIEASHGITASEAEDSAKGEA